MPINWFSSRTKYTPWMNSLEQDIKIMDISLQGRYSRLKKFNISEKPCIKWVISQTQERKTCLSGRLLVARRICKNTSWLLKIHWRISRTEDIKTVTCLHVSGRVIEVLILNPQAYSWWPCYYLISFELLNLRSPLLMNDTVSYHQHMQIVGDFRPAPVERGSA